MGPPEPERLAPTAVRVNWPLAFGAGLAVAVVGGLIWGAIGALTGYIFTLIAVGIGYAVAWALVKGGGTISMGMIPLAIILTLFAVFVGDIVAFSIIAVQFGATPVDVILNYPAIVAAFPGETLGGYFFGFLGAGLSGYSLWQQKRRAMPPVPAMVFPLPAAPGTPPAAGTLRARVLSRGLTDVTLEVTFPPPAHVLVASYTSNGLAEVYLDGTLVAKTRVWGTKKEVPVPMDQGARTVQVLFHGAARPHVDVFVDGRLGATA